ncbi:MAG TPA: DUF1810 family protein [Ilumatobacteraceae bacterium]|nr:DUF1810 family protein [Ilumatobacteraceae bacterium]
MPEIHLQRFVDAQHNSFERALSEIEAGAKGSHWMWYVFPQIVGLGQTTTSLQYAIDSVEEAQAFLAHPVLGERYLQIVHAVWNQVVQRGVTVHDLFGSPDDIKLVSSLTLFSGAARQLESDDFALFVHEADEILQAAYAQGLGRCTTTEELLAR